MCIADLSPCVEGLPRIAFERFVRRGGCVRPLYFKWKKPKFTSDLNLHESCSHTRPPSGVSLPVFAFQLLTAFRQRWFPKGSNRRCQTSLTRQACLKSCYSTSPATEAWSRSQFDTSSRTLLLRTRLWLQLLAVVFLIELPCVSLS